ncbi:MAG: adenosylcobinamide-phosphate synthase CbiB [Halopenitus sp.]
MAVLAAAAMAVLAAATLDRVIGEPPARFHPVVWLGKPVGYVDRAFTDSRLAGVAAAALLPVAFASVAAGVVIGGGLVGASAGSAAALPDQFGLVVATVLAALVLFVCTSLRMLVDVANDVIALSTDDLDAAREALLALAGRDASSLSAELVRSAAVESAAENLADGQIAPLIGFAVGAIAASYVGATELALPTAAATAAWVKGVNTLDSMLGYRSKPVGWAPARLDDVVMWVPARVAALLLSAVALAPGALRRARTWARIPNSPNSGWPMATMAAVLDVRLEKPATYTLNPNGSLPDAEQANRGVKVVDHAGWLAVVLGGLATAAAAGLASGVSVGV